MITVGELIYLLAQSPPDQMVDVETLTSLLERYEDAMAGARSRVAGDFVKREGLVPDTGAGRFATPPAQAGSGVEEVPDWVRDILREGARRGGITTRELGARIGVGSVTQAAGMYKSKQELWAVVKAALAQEGSNRGAE